MLFLLPTIFTLWLTALPSFPAMPTTPASPLHKRIPKCHEIPRQLAIPIETVDCIVALNMMPATEAMGGVGIRPTDPLGLFSLRADPATNFRLPRHFAWGGCMIGVTIANTRIISDQDTSSWNRIARAAFAIIRECVQQPPAEMRVGGSEAVGTLGKIQIDVFRHQRHLQFLVDLNKPPSPGPMRPPAPRPPRYIELIRGGGSSRLV